MQRTADNELDGRSWAGSGPFATGSFEGDGPPAGKLRSTEGQFCSHSAADERLVTRVRAGSDVAFAAPSLSPDATPSSLLSFCLEHLGSARRPMRRLRRPGRTPTGRLVSEATGLHCGLAYRIARATRGRPGCRGRQPTAGSKKFEPWPVGPRHGGADQPRRSASTCSRTTQIFALTVSRALVLSVRRLARRGGPGSSLATPRRWSPCVFQAPELPDRQSGGDARSSCQEIK